MDDIVLRNNPKPGASAREVSIQRETNEQHNDSSLVIIIPAFYTVIHLLPTPPQFPSFLSALPLVLRNIKNMTIQTTHHPVSNCRDCLDIFLKLLST